ncbi:MAG: AAA family ATPase [Gordonia sp. (in: high G+C Gram-positive bacteria)]
MPAHRASSLIVTGPAGSGKTTLGHALAQRLKRPLLDLDSLTNPLLDSLAHFLPGPHWNVESAATEAIRQGRYAVLRQAARDLIADGAEPILIAPFTRELTGGTEWAELVDALAPTVPRVVYLTASPEILAARRAERGAQRDALRVDTAVPDVAVPHLAMDARRSVDDLAEEVVTALRTPVQ